MNNPELIQLYQQVQGNFDVFTHLELVLKQPNQEVTCRVLYQLSKSALSSGKKKGIPTNQIKDQLIRSIITGAEDQQIRYYAQMK